MLPSEGWRAGQCTNKDRSNPHFSLYAKNYDVDLAFSVAPAAYRFFLFAVSIRSKDTDKYRLWHHPITPSRTPLFRSTLPHSDRGTRVIRPRPLKLVLRNSSGSSRTLIQHLQILMGIRQGSRKRPFSRYRKFGMLPNEKNTPNLLQEIKKISINQEKKAFLGIPEHLFCEKFAEMLSM